MILVLDKAMNILDFISRSPEKEFPLAEIASALSMDKGTCTNILKTLLSSGFVQQSAPRSGYKLGYKLYNITGRAVENEELTKIAREDVTLLGSTLNETALLSVIRNDKRIVLFNSEPDRALVVRTSKDKSIYTACTGRAIIANYTPSHLDKLMVRLGLPTEDDWPEIYESENPSGELRNQLAKIKQNGYATQTDRNGIIGFAAPIFREGHVAGSIGVYLPQSRMNDFDYYRSSVMDCARRVNEKIKKYY